MQILQTGAAPAAGKSKNQKPNTQDDADPEADEDLDDEGDGEENGGEKKAKAKKAAADSGLEDDDEPEGDEKKEDDGEEKSEDDDEAEADGDDDPDANLDDEDKKTRATFNPAQQAKFDKAVQKKARRIIDLKTELEEEREARASAEKERDEVRSTPPTAIAATADNPLAAVDDETKLDDELTKARKVRRFALANPDGAYVDTKTGQVVELQLEEGEKAPEGVSHFSKKRIGEILADTEELLNEHGPKRRTFLQDRAKAEADAVQEFPSLKNKNSEVALHVESQLRKYPALRAVSGIRLILADSFIGSHARAKAKAAAAAAKSGAGKSGDGARKAPPSPGGGTKPGKISGREKVTQGAMQTLARSGDDPDNAGLLALLKS